MQDELDAAGKGGSGSVKKDVQEYLASSAYGHKPNSATKYHVLDRPTPQFGRGVDFISNRSKDSQYLRQVVDQ